MKLPRWRLTRSSTPRRILIGACYWLAAVGFAAAAPEAGANEKAVRDLPAAFKVSNTNTSGVACASDAAEHIVRGQLVGPRSALEGTRARAVTVYLHGFNVGGFMWRMPGRSELDHPAALAKLGHVSLIVDRLGYDRSDHPHGWQTCFGSQADVVQQLVRRLRSGDYTVTGARPTTFQTVVLAGHDAGAAIADIAAYSYRDVDALVHFNWADQGFTSTGQMGYAQTLPICGRGGQAAEQGQPRDDPAGGPSGYVQFLTDEDIRRDAHPNTAREVVAVGERRWNRNPCGEFVPAPQVARISAQRLPEITIPVLYGYGELEFLWSQEGLAQQAQHFRNSRDLTTAVIRDAGHFPMFSRVAPDFHSTVAEWLRSRRLLSTGALTAAGCSAKNKTIAGGPGADLMRGTPAPDNLIGGDGRDRLSGAGGADCVRGNRDRDRLHGGDGDDSLAGHSGRDRISGGAGDDRMEGHSGGDRLRGGPGRDLVIGGGGRDRIHVADGERDRVRCGPGRDRVKADAFDRIRGCESIRRVSSGRQSAPVATAR